MVSNHGFRKRMELSKTARFLPVEVVLYCIPNEGLKEEERALVHAHATEHVATHAAPHFPGDSRR